MAAHDTRTTLAVHANAASALCGGAFGPAIVFAGDIWPRFRGRESGVAPHRISKAD